jgi:hypothetical protein
MPDSDTFAAHAARCQQEAADATLDNVRERALRSEAAWSAMAARSLKSETSRDAREARRLDDIAPAVFTAASATD